MRKQSRKTLESESRILVEWILTLTRFMVRKHFSRSLKFGGLLDH